MKKKRKTRWIVTLSIVGILLIGAGVFVYAQWNNIQALSYAKQYTAEQREKMLRQNEAAVQEILNKVPDVQIVPLSEEDEALLQSGQLSEEEALARIMGTSSAETQQQEENMAPEDSGNFLAEEDNETVQEDAAAESSEQEQSEQPVTENSVQPTNQPDKQTQDTSRLQELLARIYLLRSSFTGQLNALVEQAKAEVIASGSKENIFSIASKYIGMGNNLEAQCDAQMESLLNEIYTELERTGGDTGMVEDIRAAYKNEKSITKAALIDKYY